MYTALLIDDEKHCTEILALKLQQFCPEIEILAICNSSTEGLEKILQLQPDVVFLDIEMPTMNGFDILKRIKNINFKVIFTTAYDEFALKAIKISALDYLLKPIQNTDLIEAVTRLKDSKTTPLPSQMELLLQQINQPAQHTKKIAVPTFEGIELILVDKIVYCHSEGNYTYLYFEDSTKLMVSKTLKYFSQLFEAYQFIRTHHSYLVNMNKIKKFVRLEGGYLIMEEGSQIPVSKRKKEDLLDQLKQL